jgi:hypothetical protein
MNDNFNEKLESWMQTDDFKKQVNEEKSNQIKLDSFLTKFTLKYIKSMSIEEYVAGRENKDSFCYWVEQRLSFFGAMSQRTNAYQKFVIYWSEDKKAYIFGNKRTNHRKFFGSSIEEIYKNIVIQLSNLIDGVKKNDYKAIAESPFNPQFKNKISYLYDSKHQIPIYGEDDLNVILTILGIDWRKDEDRTFKRQKLYDYYLQNSYDKKISTYLFMSFIYGWYGYRHILRSYDKPTIDIDTIKNYILVDIQINSVIGTNRSGEGTKKNIIFKSGSEESKRITGKKGEDIVFEYLKEHQKDLCISNITCYCNGEDKNDGKGCDITYIQTDGKTIYVEVKSTKSDMQNQVFFEMSSNEYSVMKAHLDTYYIFFINNVDNNMVIQRIVGKDIYGEEPIKYKIHFESKKKIDNCF